MDTRMRHHSRRLLGGTKRSARRTLRLEALESRQMLSADPLAGVSQLSRFASADELSQYLLADAVERYKYTFGQPQGTGIFALTADASPLGTAVAKSYSSTNVQVAGVDEGDTVETDGNYLYLLAGNKLTIVDARQADQLHVTGQVTIDDSLVGEYLLGDRLAVLSRNYIAYTCNDLTVTANAMSILPLMEQHFTLTIVDVSDRTAPHVEQKTTFEGNLVDSRVIGNTLCLVSNQDFTLAGPLVKQETSTYETQEEYLARINGHVLEMVLPNYTLYGADGQPALAGLLEQATDVYRPFATQHERLTSVTMVDLAAAAAPAPTSTAVPTAWWNQIYVTPSSAYLFQSDWGLGGEQTSICKFALDPTAHSANLTAVGSVPGRLLNQFSADEYQGQLRLATTSGWGALAQNQLYVLRQDGENLNLVGRLEGIAPGESIYAARFIDAQAFLVTFRRTDPLFSVDLSDPTTPRLTGELVSPGNSSYLHSIGDGYLVGLGKDADPFSGRETSAQISLFNVADPAQPQLADRLRIDPQNYSWLTVGYDHHAFTYDPGSHVIAVPISGVSGTPLWVFHVNIPAGDSLAPAASLELLGAIAHDTAVCRSVQIGDRLYAISYNCVTAHELLHPEVLLAKVAFNPYTNDPPVSDPGVRVTLPPSERPQLSALPTGDDTLGLYDPRTAKFWLKNTNATGYHDLAFGYGVPQAGWIPLAGDWNGDGTVTIGLFDPQASAFYLSDGGDPVVADRTIYYGPAGANWTPLVGDWNGDGVDTIGLYDPQTSVFHLRNTNTTGVADLAFGYGTPQAGWLPVAGDWDGDGTDSVALYDASKALFMLRNHNTEGGADANVAFGTPGANCRPVAGDWNNDGIDSIGLYDAALSRFYLRNTNTTGVADVTADYGVPGWLPVVGDWNRPKNAAAPTALNTDLVDGLFRSTL